MNLLSVSSPYAGKALSKSQLNLLAKLATLNIDTANIRPVRTNPFTQVSHELDPLAVTLYDFITEANGSRMTLVYRGQAVKVSVWDAARYLFLHLWPSEYYDLLD